MPGHPRRTKRPGAGPPPGGTRTGRRDEVFPHGPIDGSIRPAARIRGNLGAPPTGGRRTGLGGSRGGLRPRAPGRRPRVLILSPFPAAGAVEAYARTLAEGLPSHGWDVTLVVPDDAPGWGRGPGTGSRGARLLAVPGFRLRSVRRLRSLLRHVGPDVVHVNDVFLPGMAAALLPRAVRTVVTCHTPALPVSWSRKGRALARWSAPRVDAWVALSPRNARLLGSRMAVDGCRIRVIPPGLAADPLRELGRREARRALGIPPGAFVVGTVGRLARQKRHDLLIRAGALAAPRVPELTVLVLGEGELRREVEALARRELPGRVVLAGHVEDVPSLLPAVDVFCLPSDFEGMPFALLEAMGAGRPIVVTDVPGSGEAIADGVHGLVVPPGAAGALAGAIVRLAGDRELARRLGARARARFLAEFTAGPMVGRTAGLYREVVEGEGR